MSSDNDHVFGEDTGSDVFEICFVKPDPDATEDAVEDIQQQREPKRVKKKQYDTIDAFMKEHKETAMDKQEHNELWNNLVEKLNSLGPPTFTNIEWRRKWSIFKYNSKRKKLSTASQDVSQDKPLNIVPSSVPLSSEAANTKMIELLTALVESNKAVAAKQDIIINNLVRSNQLLEKIAKKST